MNRLKLTLLTIFKYIFVAITVVIGWPILIIEVLVMLLTLARFETGWSEWYGRNCIKVLSLVLDKEISILLKTKNKNESN